MRYKVGDEVVVRGDMGVGSHPLFGYFPRKEFAGNVAKVTLIDSEGDYRLDQASMWWDDSMIDHEATAMLKDLSDVDETPPEVALEQFTKSHKDVLWVKRTNKTRGVRTTLKLASGYVGRADLYYTDKDDPVTGCYEALVRAKDAEIADLRSEASRFVWNKDWFIPPAYTII